MRRGPAGLLALCAALPAIGCSWIGADEPPSAARERLVESALAVLRERLDLPVETWASEIQRVLLSNGSLAPATRQLLFEHHMVWLGVHQLIGFGQDRARIESILARLAFDEHGPFFPPGLEGHPGQVTAELSRLGVDPGERFAAGSRTVTPAELVQSVRDRYDTATVAVDPAWLIWGACAFSGRPTT
jgi:hypothetical protein